MTVSTDLMGVLEQSAVPVSVTAALLTLLYAMRADRSSQDEVQILAANFKPDLSFVGMIENETSVSLMNGSAGSRTWLHSLMGLHMPSEGGSGTFVRPWNLFGTTFPTQLEAGDSLTCEASGDSLDLLPLHSLHAGVSWARRPRKNQLITVAIPVASAPANPADRSN